MYPADISSFATLRMVMRDTLLHSSYFNLLFKHPPIHFPLPINKFFLFEPQFNFLFAILHRIGGMGKISPDFEGKIMSKRTRRGFGGTRGAHGLADRGNRV